MIPAKLKDIYTRGITDYELAKKINEIIEYIEDKERGWEK